MRTQSELVEILNAATVAYDLGKPVMSDKEWDDLYFELVNLENESGTKLDNSPTNKVNFDVVSDLKKVKHNHLMLSLAKTKDVSEVNEFSKHSSVTVMSKMDGLTCSLLYLQGKLIKAETRGDGVIGEDVTHNAMIIKSIPKTIPAKETVVIDGEVICTYKDFDKFSNDYKNPRNFASGSIRLLDSKECLSRNLTFVAWDVISGGPTRSLNSNLNWLDTCNFTTVPREFNPSDLGLSFELIKDKSSYLSYPIDGCVIKYDDIDYYLSLGNTDHHFRGGLAYKFYDETVTTHLIDIEWTMGKTGVLTPVAVFDPVEIDGTTVQKASLHNLSILKDVMGIPYVGQEIEVFKANMIIPQIYSAVKSDKGAKLTNPTVCPVCGRKLIEDWKSNGVGTLICSNTDCSSKLVNRLKHFVSKQGVDIDGLSVSTLTKLIEWGWVTNFSDLYSLYNRKDEWYTKPGFSKVSVDKLLLSIENSKGCDLANYICAFSVPNVGLKYAKLIADRFKTIENFISDFKTFDFTSIDGIGEVMNNSIHNFDFTELINLSKIFNITNIAKDSNSGSLENLNFVITGSLKLYRNRAELVDVILNSGGRVSDSVTAKTDYLVNNDISSLSSKNKKAKELNVKIITEEQFKELL